MEIAPGIRRMGDGMVNSYLVEARYVLPGHGQPWTGGLAAGLAEVRAAAVAATAPAGS